MRELNLRLHSLREPNLQESFTNLNITFQKKHCFKQKNILAPPPRDPSEKDIGILEPRAPAEAWRTRPYGGRAASCEKSKAPNTCLIRQRIFELCGEKFLFVCFNWFMFGVIFGIYCLTAHTSEPLVSAHPNKCCGCSGVMPQMPRWYNVMGNSTATPKVMKSDTYRHYNENFTLTMHAAQ